MNKMLTVKNTLGLGVSYKRIEFSDGTHNIEIISQSWELDSNVDFIITIPAGYPTFDTVLWDLLMLCSALKRVFPGSSVSLYFEYLPNARADRAFTDYNPKPLECFCININKLIAPRRVWVCVPHNASALPESWIALDDRICMELLGYAGEDAVVVYPDKGALARFKDYKVTSSIVMQKTRDVATGAINGMSILHRVNMPTLPLLRFLIVDDICDGGRTFIECAKILKDRYPGCHVTLAVAHGIFAKGLSVFEGLIDHIYSFNIVGSYVTRDDINLFNSKGK